MNLYHKEGEVKMNRTRKEPVKKTYYFWVQHMQRAVFFSPVEDARRQEFANRDEMITSAKQYVSFGYQIG